MNNTCNFSTTPCREKVQAIFAELVGSESKKLDGACPPLESREIISSALAEQYGERNAHEMALHLIDWNSGVAFLAAVMIFPERFTKEEIQEGVVSLLIEAPEHIIAAARLGGYSVKDTFK